jgi:CDP-diacylglycerol--glycerol-3-phosphate 3-phosphatidyltransferase
MFFLEIEIMYKHIPNILAVLRLLSTPIILGLLTYNRILESAILFWLGSFTDFLDGYLARKWNVNTKIGGFLDMIADKILVTGTLLGLLTINRISVWTVFGIVSRELLIMGLRSSAALDNINIVSSMCGKIKATLQFGLVLGSMLWPNSYLIRWSVCITIAMTWISGLDYIYKYINQFY